MCPTYPSDVIALSETDRSSLQTFVRRGQETARWRTRAQVLLKLGEGWSLEVVCAAFDVCRNTAVRVRRRFQEGGVDAVLTDQRQERYHQALTGPQQAHLIAVACSKVPDGHDHWTMRMLPKNAVEMGFVEKIPTVKSMISKPTMPKLNQPQRPSRPVSDTATLEQRACALETERNERRATIDWQFTARQARVKLNRLYPVVPPERD